MWWGRAPVWDTALHGTQSCMGHSPTRDAAPHRTQPLGPSDPHGEAGRQDTTRARSRGRAAAASRHEETQGVLARGQPQSSPANGTTSTRAALNRLPHTHWNSHGSRDPRSFLFLLIKRICLQAFWKYSANHCCSCSHTFPSSAASLLLQNSEATTQNNVSSKNLRNVIVCPRSWLGPLSDSTQTAPQSLQMSTQRPALNWLLTY